MNNQGKLLIARPSLDTSFFKRTVVYICQDTINGSSGIVLNKLLDGFTVNDVCEMHNPYLEQYPLYHGGPVKSQSVTMLHTEGWTSANTINIGNGLSISSDEFMLEKLASGDEPDNWRLFAGICMWSHGQLESELYGHSRPDNEDSWILAEPSIDDIFYDTYQDHWDHAIELFSSQMVKTYF